ncbi:hypothetical protein C7B61_02910, partial [filamentous cyanobacterium CCP1]
MTDSSFGQDEHRFNPQDLYAQGWDFYDSGQHDDALAAFGQVLELDTKHCKAWYGRGVILSELNNYEEALASFTRAVEINPNYSEAWFSQGVVLFDLNRDEEALASFTTAIEVDPDYLDAWINRGVVLERLNRHEEAIESFIKVTEANPNHATAWSNLGSALSTVERFAEAIASCTRAIEINPDSSSAWLNRGNAFWYLGQYAEALRDYDKTLELEPDNSDVWANRVGILNALGQYDEAEVSNARAIRLNAKLHPSLAVPQHKLPAVNESVVINRHTDFPKAFHDGYTFYQDLVYFGTSEVTFSTYELGELNLTSGCIVACDPSIKEAFRCPFIQYVEPGRYPVFLSVAYEEVSGYSNIACAMIRFREGEAIQWELAQVYVPGSSETGEVYAVNSGIGCFMDVDAAEVLYGPKMYTSQEKAANDAVRLTGDTRQINEAIGTASDRSWNHFQQEFDERLRAEMG